MSPEVKAGVLTAAVAGAVMVALTGWAGELVVSIVGVGTLTALLLFAGWLFGVSIETGHLRLGFGPGITFWAAAFAASRVIQEGVLGLFGEAAGFADGVIAFTVYQTLVGGAFGLGYLLLYQQILTPMRSGADASSATSRGQ